MADTTSINDQIKDSIEQIQALLADDDGQNTRALSYQLMSHAASLAFYNTVHQQQQMYVLQNAITTAAAKAILEASPEDALKYAKEGFASQDMTGTLTELKKFMDDLNETYKDLRENLSEDTSSTPTVSKKKARSKKKTASKKKSKR